jgi:glycosyltransferase involved in cell wall biosynthesis
MDLSIIIPCHNLEQHIGKCIESITRQQTDKYEVELIFALDNCHDNTRMKIEDALCHPDTYKIKYEIIEGSWGSSGLARNAALKIAKGKYIWFVDGDDWINGTKAITDIMTTFANYPQIEIIKFGYSSQGFFWDLDEVLGRYVYSRKAIGETIFDSEMPGEGYKFVREIRKKQHRQAVVNYRYYHFCFPREGSVSSGKII